MSFEYIAQAYGKTFKKNQIVKVSTDGWKTTKLGVVLKATNHVFVRLDGEKHAHPYHPSDVEPAT